ncbi:hypothetical protein AB6D56_06505 [Vibrio lentus]
MKPIDISNTLQPLESSQDKVYRTVKAILSFNPISNALGDLLPNPYVERQEQWMRDITDVVNELFEKYNFNIEKLFENKVFLSSLAQASTIAWHDHTQDKRMMLKQVILSSALVEDFDDVKKSLFISAIGSMTSLHLIVLKYCVEPYKCSYGSSNSLGLVDGVIDALPELNGNVGLASHIVNDLRHKGFVSSDIHDERSYTEDWGIGLGRMKQTTELGDEFLQYVCGKVV